MLLYCCLFLCVSCVYSMYLHIVFNVCVVLYYCSCVVIDMFMVVVDCELSLHLLCLYIVFNACLRCCCIVLVLLLHYG